MQGRETVFPNGPETLRPLPAGRELTVLFPWPRCDVTGAPPATSSTPSPETTGRRPPPTARLHSSVAVLVPETVHTDIHPVREGSGGRADVRDRESLVSLDGAHEADVYIYPHP